MRRALRECAICGERRVRDYHHIVPKCMGGSDKAFNRVNLCPTHHRLVHQGLITINGWLDLVYTSKLDWQHVDGATAKPLISKDVQYSNKRKRLLSIAS
jgi:predicted restriction endonuclease